jgi:pectin methylesterase-like acyl-CoA thioesterase
VDAKVNVLSLARDCSPQHTASANIVGTLTFNSGTIDANTVLVGNQSLGPSASTTPCKGFLSVNGPNAKLVVNNNLVLGSTVQTSSGAAINTSGILSIRDGAVLANTISVGGASATNAITMTNGLLVLTNTLASTSRALSTLATTNSTLQLNVTGASAIIAVTNLVTAGATNIINPSSVSVFGSYPVQAVLIKYDSSKTIGGAGFNFGLGAHPLPPTAPGAYLSNNVANHSIDLVLPYDPRPVITNVAGQPISVPANPDPGNDVTLSIGISPNTVLPVGYQWYFNSVPVTDGPTGNGSTNSGSASADLLILNAQTNDSGDYTVIITNIYGSATSSVLSLVISTNPAAPHIAGPPSPTVIQGNTAILATAVSGKPVATLQWQFNGVNLTDGPTGNGDTISGSTSSVLTIGNAQYPASQGTYSIIASNSAGMATNSGFLTVIVPPTISVQPVSLVVTTAQSASFSVSASGVPAPGYQWLKNNAPITGNASAQTSTLLLNTVSAADIATYSVQVSNTAGSTNSQSATLVVNSLTMAPVAFTPANGATGICYDTPLRLTFNQAPSLRKAGKVRIYNAASPATPVDTLDLTLNQDLPNNGATNVQPRIILGDAFYTYPVIITGNTAAIYPHLDVLTSNQTYYVTVDDGVFTDSTGAYFVGITNPATWQFSTKIAGPANPTNIVVAADGTGDFLTVQGAIDSVPTNNTTLTLINIRNGFYTEILNVKSRNNIDFRGQTRTGTFIGYPNNNNVNQSGAPLRAMIVLNANDCTFENITLTNTTPKGGSQAEAVDVEGTRCTFYNLELDSYQDTFLVHSMGKLVYFQDCLIQGDTDFNWGYGSVFYTNCELRCLSTGSHVTQPRSPLGSNGFAFVNCKVTKGTGVTSSDLGRSIGTPSTPSEAIFITTLLDDVITGYASDAGTNFWYSSCSNLTATQQKTSLTFATLLQPTDPIVLAAQSATNWLYGWFPQVLPNILANPTSQNVPGSGTISLSIAATGLPGLSYQWFKDGIPVSGQTNATLTIPGANVNNSGSYSVVVSNILGVLTSSAANVLVSNSAPTLAPIPSTTNNVGVTVSITPSASDPDSPPQTLSFTLVSGPFTTFDTNSGAYTWRPDVSAAGTVNPIQIAVTDNGSPNLSATQSFVVAVNQLTQPTVSAPAYAAGQFTLSVDGQTGPDYEVFASTNLTDWVSLVTNTSPTMPFLFTDPNAASYPQRFYRIVVGPPPR